MVHSVEELVLVNEAADEKIDEAEEEDEKRAGEDAVDGADDENEDSLWEEEAVRKHGRLNQLSVIPRSLSTNEIDRVERDAAEFQEAEGK